MKPICIFITLLFNSFYSTTPLFSQNIFDKQHSLDFAKYLINTQQYDYASIELERICFLEKNDTLNYFLIKTYRLSKKYEIGEKRTIQIYLNRALMPALPAKEYGLILLKQMKTDSLRLFLQENHYLDVAYKTQIELTSYIFEMKWEKSSQYI